MTTSTDPSHRPSGIVDLEGGMRLLDGGRTDRLPTVLLVEDDDVPALAADVARRLQPAGVCRWPDGRDALPGLVARTVGTTSRRRRAAACCASAASRGRRDDHRRTRADRLAAWSGQRALAVVHGHAGVRDATPVPADAVVAPDLWVARHRCPDSSGARVVHTGERPPVPPAEDRRVELSVLDVGTGPRSTSSSAVLTVRPPSSCPSRWPVRSSSSAGPAHPERVHELAGGRRVVHVPTSVRVARAVLRGHVPAGLPGSWLDELRPVLDAG
jgi:hypothetical protein